MKKRILLFVAGLMIISSIGAYATDLKYLKETNFTGWSQDTYFESGDMVTSKWLNLNGKWYYFKADGIKTTGWLQLNNNWYYLDSQGAMQTGWIKDTNRKWYYLNSDGTMAHDTTVDGCVLGSDGVWIK
jgi:glucan-binding YG repeat protein